MKLQSITSVWFIATLLLVISLWAGIFYYALLDEIYDSIDDGLDNQKQLIIQKTFEDSTILSRVNFEESGYAIKELPAIASMHVYDRYVDTSMYMHNEDDFEPVRMLTTVFRRRDTYYQLQVVTSMVEEDDLIAELLYSLLWLFLGLIVSIIILNKALLRKIWASFYHLLEQLRNYKLDSKEELKLKNTTIEEFQLLNDTIQTLLKKSKETYNSQKQFIENASHELQTPLAISINKLEVLAEKNNLPESELQLLGSVLDNLERMTRLNRSLLLLSRIENKQFVHAELININDMVKKVLDDFADQLEYSNINVTIIEHQQCIININRDLCIILLTNLMKNAIVHNYIGGTIKLIIEAKSVVIENTGSNIALDHNTIFSRFYKQSPTSSSTGLGLSIVKSITNIYGYSIQYKFENQHIITMVFI